METKKQILFPELSYQIIQVLFEVHNQLGPGFTEDIYERAVLHEFKLKEILFEHQKQIEIRYKGEFLGNYRLDILVDNSIILELKAVNCLNDLFKQQVLSYLKASGHQLGILVNFGERRLQYQRIVN